MNTTPRTVIVLITLAILLPAAALLAAEPATVSDLAGPWHGKSRFTGISYEEATQKKIAPQEIETALHVSADGRVTGRIGGAELTNCIVALNRGWFGRRLHLWTDFIIRGQIVGAIVPGSEGGTHPISAPFDFDGTRIGGTLFGTSPARYPYPFSSLELTRVP